MLRLELQQQRRETDPQPLILRRRRQINRPLLARRLRGAPQRQARKGSTAAPQVATATVQTATAAVLTRARSLLRTLTAFILPCIPRCTSHSLLNWRRV